MSVLIVEDESIVARNLKIIVEKLGYEVSGIESSGEGAVESAADTGRDLKVILMDITLKGDMDGIEAARRIQSLHNIPLIYITGNKDQMTINRALAATEPFAIVNKPFNVGVLESVISNAVDASEEGGDKFTGPEMRTSQRLQANGHPWEKVFISRDITPWNLEVVLLDNISREGIGILSEMVYHSHIKYRVNIVLPTPLGIVKGSLRLCHSCRREGMVYSGFRLVLEGRDRLAWEEYIKQVSGGGH